MDSPENSLDTLPTEIIQRIAAVSTCESVLNLIRVNRRLHQTCYNNTVFKDILKNGSGHDAITVPWNFDLSSETNTSTLARLALADSCARVWVPSVVDDTRGIESNDGEIFGADLFRAQTAPSTTPTAASDPVLRWALQLVILNHPFFTTPGHCQRIVDKLLEVRSLSDDDSAKVEFCIAATILHHSSQLEYGSFNRADFLQYLRRLLASRSSLFSSPLSSVASLVLDTHSLFTENLLPCPSRMSFSDLLNGPSVPFSDNEVSGSSHLPIMTSCDFLKDSEWVGYYNYDVNLGSMRWDPPMRGMKFSAVSIAGGRCAVGASGRDRMGAFRVRGTVAENGEVDLKKIYRGGSIREVVWDFTATMTPFGMFGTWGAHDEPHGHLWLWRREWAKE